MACGNGLPEDFFISGLSEELISVLPEDPLEEISLGLIISEIGRLQMLQEAAVRERKIRLLTAQLQGMRKRKRKAQGQGRGQGQVSAPLFQEHDLGIIVPPQMAFDLKEGVDITDEIKAKINARKEHDLGVTVPPQMAFDLKEGVVDITDEIKAKINARKLLVDSGDGGPSSGAPPSEKDPITIKANNLYKGPASDEEYAPGFGADYF